MVEITPEQDIAHQIIDNNKICTVIETDEMTRYNGGVFHRGRQSLSEIRKQITQIASNYLIPLKESSKPYNCSTSKRNEIIEIIKSNTFESIVEFDQEDNRVNIINGEIHFYPSNLKKANNLWEFIATEGLYEINESGTHFTNHPLYNESPYLSFVQLPLMYDPEAECLEVDQFLEDIFGFERVPDIYEMLAYFLMPTVRYQKAFILYGPPKTGKTSFINLVNQFIGGKYPERLISGVPLQDLDIQYQISNLRNKMLNIFDDLKSTKLTTSARFRMSVTNPTLTAEVKYINDHLTWKNICKHLFACNQLPGVGKNTGDEFWRRWKLFDCFNEMDDSKQDLSFANKRWGGLELSGVLNACIKAWARLEKRKHFRNDDQEYVKGLWQMDIEPAKMFVDENCQLDIEAEVNVDVFWNSLNTWRAGLNVNPISKTMLTQSLQRISGDISKPKRRKGDKWVYKGIQIIKGEIVGELIENNEKLDKFTSKEYDHKKYWVNEKDYSDEGAF
ncbi:hypothetical protein LCGC14_1705980 [marine sediment metagenome]|uniref:SF3 helicase domain-containing protein n=1 Tax=marine sediment metagenome TaxID=412755 RepID=A0A0F9JX08_9ZZZZ